MLKTLLCSLLLFLHANLFSQEKEFPRVIDFSTFDPWQIPGYAECDLEAMSRFSPFNGALEFCPFFAYLKNTYAIRTAVETGTWHGSTAAFLGYLFDNVYTIELDADAFIVAQANLSSYPNIQVCYGNSPDILRQILPLLKGQRLLFYLDAHWFADWPLLRELEEISKTHKNNCIIVIDDFKVPGRPDILYDRYGNQECSYAYIHHHLRKIFSEYKFHYLIPKSIDCRAKFVAIPKKWAI